METFDVAFKWFATSSLTGCTYVRANENCNHTQALHHRGDCNCVNHDWMLFCTCEPIQYQFNVATFYSRSMAFTDIVKESCTTRSHFHRSAMIPANLATLIECRKTFLSCAEVRNCWPMIFTKSVKVSNWFHRLLLHHRIRLSLSWRFFSTNFLMREYVHPWKVSIVIRAIFTADRIKPGQGYPGCV